MDTHKDLHSGALSAVPQRQSMKSRRPAHLAVALLSACVLAGCSTRQVSTTLEGSTAQRLVTYSLDQFIEDLTAQPEITALEGKTVHLGVHFLSDHPLMGYATRLIAAQLNMSNDIRVAAPADPVEYELDVFFNSMGTDSDDFGLSVPSFGLVASAESINILALDMYHGVTEGYAIVKTTADGSLQQTERVLARIRKDNVSTPVIDFPLNQVK
ncbi:hypothetical protein ACUNV4_08595 [Granulosicoccus sp. 3-233]|uniref:hypothetical protein n=1 Tax=Granulosicoccus sp. 3-233 TaxID=3417969 RepID=UPI003D34588F